MIKMGLLIFNALAVLVYLISSTTVQLLCHMFNEHKFCMFDFCKYELNKGNYIFV